MRPLARSAVALAAAATIVAATGGTALASRTPPTPLQIAASYMKVPAKVTQKIPLRTKPPSGVKAVFMNGPTGQLQPAIDAMREVTDSLGWTFTSMIADVTSGASVEAFFGNAIQQGQQIVFAPGLTLSVVSASMQQRLADAKIAVIVGLGCPTSPFVAPFFGGPALCQQAGAEALALANWVAADANGKPANALLINTVQFSQLKLFGDEFKRQLLLACPRNCTVEIQPVTFAQVLSSQVPSLAVNRLRANPSLNYLVFDNGGVFAQGILPALDAAGLLGKIHVIGKAPSPADLTSLANKQTDAWVITPQLGTAYGFLDSAFRILTKSSGITLNAKQPLRLITTDNIGTIPIPYLVTPPDSLAQYKKLWHMS